MTDWRRYTCVDLIFLKNICAHVGLVKVSVPPFASLVFVLFVIRTRTLQASALSPTNALSDPFGRFGVCAYFFVFTRLFARTTLNYSQSLTLSPSASVNDGFDEFSELAKSRYGASTPPPVSAGVFTPQRTVQTDGLTNFSPPTDAANFLSPLPQSHTSIPLSLTPLSTLPEWSLLCERCQHLGESRFHWNKSVRLHSGPLTPHIVTPCMRSDLPAPLLCPAWPGDITGWLVIWIAARN
jgi:hypothetical protein